MYLLMFEDWKEKTKPTVLVLHGLNGKHDNKQLKRLEELGITPLAVSIDYRNSNAWEIIKNLEVDGVIGHSIGGYLAYYFSNFKQVPCLMFMPDFGREMYEIQPLPIEVLDSPVFKNKMAVTGKMDKNVAKKAERIILRNIKTYVINTWHDVSIPVFEKYSKIFKRFLKS